MTEIDVCDNPVFVLGPPRSGTSMMQHALRAHPNIWGGQESDYLVPMVDGLRDVWEFGRRRERLHWLSGQDVDWDEFLRHIGLGINTLYMSRSGGLRWVEQTPLYTQHLDDMVRLFPGAQFLFMVRDGREVVHSLRNFVNPMRHKRACETWRDFITAGLRFAEGPHAERLHFVSYRAASTETTAEMHRVFEFIGEPFAQASVDFITKKPINSSFGDGDGTGEDSAGGPRWMVWSASERETFKKVAGDLLIELGIESDAGWVDARVASG